MEPWGRCIRPLLHCPLTSLLPPSRAADFPEFLYLDLAVENGTSGLASTRPVTWQVEYPGQDPEAEKDKMVWEIQVSERDVRALVPLVKVRPCGSVPAPGSPPEAGSQSVYPLGLPRSKRL